MKHHTGILSAFAILASVLCSSAHASPPACSAATLKGAYAFIAHGAVLGVIKSDGTVDPFVTAQPLDDVAIITYDGVNSFKRTDFGMIAGKPKGGATTFGSDQYGSYTVNADCTGTMTITYTGGGTGIVLGLEMVIGDDGTLVDALITSETVPSAGPTVGGTTCSNNSCQEGVQVSMTGKKVQSWPHP